MKPREFWIRENKDYPNVGPRFYCSTASPRPPSTAFHVREVRPIDWEKVWHKIDDLAINEISTVNVDSRIHIQQLVETQLAGDE